jgi:hypothetical protein
MIVIIKEVFLLIERDIDILLPHNQAVIVLIGEKTTKESIGIREVPLHLLIHLPAHHHLLGRNLDLDLAQDIKNQLLMSN